MKSVIGAAPLFLNDWKILMYNGVSRAVNVSGINNNHKIQDYESEVGCEQNEDNFKTIER